MFARVSRRPSSTLLPALALAVLLGGAALAYQHRGDVGQAFAIAAFTVVAAGAMFALPEVDPAYPVCAGLGLSIFSGNWQYIGLPLGLDRPLLLYGVAAAVVQALPDLRRRRAPPMTSLKWWVVLLGLYGLASAVLSGTIKEHDALYALVDQFGLLAFALFVLAPSIFATERSRDILLGTLIAVGGYLAVTAIFEGLHLSAGVFPRYINDPLLGIHAERARGPFLEAASNGLALYACGVAAAMGTAKWWSRPRLRWLCATVAAGSAIGIVFTLTRQIWVGSVAATILTLASQRELRRYVLPIAVAGGLMVILALAFVPGLSHSATVRANDNSSVWDRLNSDSAAIRMVSARPLLGWGWYRFGPASTPFYRQASTYPLSTVDRLHNVFLSLAVELGLAGIAAWLLCFLGAIGSAIRQRGPPELKFWRVGLIAVAANWILVANFTPLAYAFPNHLIWLWAGIVLAIAADQLDPRFVRATA